jgi:hypothetical protein
MTLRPACGFLIALHTLAVLDELAQLLGHRPVAHFLHNGLLGLAVGAAEKLATRQHPRRVVGRSGGDLEEFLNDPGPVPSGKVGQPVLDHAGKSVLAA